MVEWVWNVYRAIRALVLFVAAVLRALLAAVVLAEDLWIHARGCVLARLALYRERRAAAATVAPVATTVADPAAAGVLAGRVVPLEELRRHRRARQEPA
jgi:hypothetical protein